MERKGYRLKKAVWMLLLLLLPSAALAVTEGVVEPAPPVSVELRGEGGALLGAWEEGLADIEAAARRVLRERLNCPDDMTLYIIEVGDDMHFNTRTGMWKDERMRAYIYINFRFACERMGGDMSAQVGFDFETGELGSCRVGRFYEGEDGIRLMEKELPAQGNTVSADVRRAKLDDYLQNALGLSGYEMLDWGQARFPDGSVLSATIGAYSGEVIAVDVSRFGEEGAVQ